MGRDKALLPFRGSTLVQHIAEQVAAAAGFATLVGNPEVYRHLGYAVIADAMAGAGPLAGYSRGFERFSGKLESGCGM